MRKIWSLRHTLGVLLMLVTIGLIAYLFFMPNTKKTLSAVQLPHNLTVLKQHKTTVHKLGNPVDASDDEARANSAKGAAQTNLPLKLLGVVVSDDKTQSSATIEAASQVHTYYLNDAITSRILVRKILIDRVLLQDEDNGEIVLMIDNSFAPGDELLEGKAISHSDTLMTAKEKALAKRIGNRPTLLAHIVKTTPQGTIDSGLAVAPGLNPSLFRSAGFKEGDILQQINGLNLSIPAQYAQAMQAIPQAQTLTFTVLRGGRTMMLFLDIPAKGLALKG